VSEQPLVIRRLELTKRGASGPETIPGERLAKQNIRAHINYYQWVPLVLLFQSLMTFLPCLLWRFFNRRSGINMTAIMDAARVCSQASYIEIREKVQHRTLFDRKSRCKIASNNLQLPGKLTSSKGRETNLP